MKPNGETLNYSGKQDAFCTTQWTMVVLAGRNDTISSGGALEKLCEAYWYPLYVYVRRRGHSSHDAQDLTQSFFSHILGKQAITGVDRELGKFRAFLLASLKNFLNTEWRKRSAEKRGGNAQIFSIEGQTAEGRYQNEPADNVSPEKIFDQRWAETILKQVVEKLKNSFAEEGHEDRFEFLKDFVFNDPTGVSYSAVADELGMTVPGVTSVIHRLRNRFRKTFREEIANTVASPNDIDDELRYLVSALAG